MKKITRSIVTDHNLYSYTEMDDVLNIKLKRNLKQYVFRCIPRLNKLQIPFRK